MLLQEPCINRDLKGTAGVVVLPELQCAALLESCIRACLLHTWWHPEVLIEVQWNGCVKRCRNNHCFLSCQLCEVLYVAYSLAGDVNTPTKLCIAFHSACSQAGAGASA